MKKFMSVAVCMAAAMGAHADSHCDGKTMAQIFNVAKPTPDVANRINAQSSKINETIASTPSNIVLPGGASDATFENFLPLLSLFGLGGDLSGNSSDSQSDEFGFDINLPFFGNASSGRELKLAVSLDRQPEAYAPLIESLAESDRANFRDQLEMDLGAEDDVSYALTYSFNTKSLGLHKDAIAPLVAGVLESVKADGVKPALVDFRDAMRAFRGAFGDVSADTCLGPVAGSKHSEREKTLRSNLVQASEALSVANKAWNERSRDMLDGAKLEALAKLAANQPQLLISVGARDRSSAVGPNEISAKLTFSWGYRASLNGLSRYIDKQGCPDGTCMADAYSTYLSQNEGAIENQDRLSFSLEYEERDNYQFVDTTRGLAFDRPRSQKTIGRLSLGHTFTSSVLKGARLEFGASYEDVDDDETLNDRAVGTLTLTRKFGVVDVPLSLVYSNKTEYVAMNSSSRLSANFGLKYNFGAKSGQ